MEKSGTHTEWRFDRREIAGSLGDLGTLLPIAVGLILVSGLPATAVLLTIGLYYVLSGLYFRVPVPVQPMKVIGGYSIAMALSPEEITSAGLWMALSLLFLALTRLTTAVEKIVPKAAVRGVQLTTGVLLLTEGIRFILGKSALQTAQGAAEPALNVASLGPVPIGVVLGVLSVVLILLLLENRRAPAALVVIPLGAAAGLLLGGYRNLSDIEIGLHLPALLPFGLPSPAHLALGLTILALPQFPMTIGNAIIAQADLTREYFGEVTAYRATVRAFTLSMALANVVCTLVGGMPLCHGAGGLAAHYRFGARTAGSNLIIGPLFLIIGLLVGDSAAALLSVLPFSVLGALLFFSGAQLALTVLDIEDRADLFVVITILGIALVLNLGVGFITGVVLSHLLIRKKISI